MRAHLAGFGRLPPDLAAVARRRTGLACLAVTTLPSLAPLAVATRRHCRFRSRLLMAAPARLGGPGEMEEGEGGAGRQRRKWSCGSGAPRERKQRRNEGRREVALLNIVNFLSAIKNLIASLSAIEIFQAAPWNLGIIPWRHTR